MEIYLAMTSFRRGRMPFFHFYVYHCKYFIESFVYGVVKEHHHNYTIMYCTY